MYSRLTQALAEAVEKLPNGGVWVCPNPEGHYFTYGGITAFDGVRVVGHDGLTWRDATAAEIAEALALSAGGDV